MKIKNIGKCKDCRSIDYIWKSGLCPRCHHKEYSKEYNKKKKHSIIFKKFIRTYKRKHNKCEICGSKKALRLHHITYDFDDSKIQMLCAKCHNQVHPIVTTTLKPLINS